MGVKPSGADGGSDELDVLITRVFNAPRALVFDVWTSPTHFARWFLPEGASMPFCELEARPGGIIHFCHQSADGTQLWVKGAFDEVRVPELLAFTVGFVDAVGNAAAHPIEPGGRSAGRQQSAPGARF